MRLLKRALAGLVSALLLTGLSHTALAAERTKATGFTLGVYVTAGLSGNCYPRDPITQEEVGETYLRAVSAVSTLAEKNTVNLLFDLGSRQEDLPILPGEDIKATALCLRQAGASLGSMPVLVPGTWEEGLSSESRTRLASLLMASGDDVPGFMVSLLDGESAPFLTRDLAVGSSSYTVGMVRLEDAARQEEAMQDSSDLIIAAAPSGSWDSDALTQQVAQTRFVDLVLVGAGADDVPSSLPNASGEEIPVAGGKGAAQCVVTVTRGGALSVGTPRHLTLSDFPNDPDLEAAILPYYEAAEELASRELVTLSDDWDPNGDLFRVQTDTMDLIHQVQLQATGANLSLAAPGAVSNTQLDTILDQQDGSFRWRDCFALYTRNDFLTVEKFTGEELKALLEQFAEEYTVSDGGLIVGNNSNALQLYGLSYDVYLENPQGSRVKNMFYQGRPVTSEQLFQVALPSDQPSDDGPQLPIPLLLAEYLQGLSSQETSLAPPQSQCRWTLNASTSASALSPISRLTFVETLYDAAGSPTAYLDLDQTFSDIAGENPAAAWAVQAGIVMGNGSGQFLPDTLVTREQAAVMLLRYDQARGAGPTGAWAVGVPYTDAADTASWASEALMWNVIRSYLLPNDGGNLRPQAVLTAAELDYAIGRLGK